MRNKETRLPIFCMVIDKMHILPLFTAETMFLCREKVKTRGNDPTPVIKVVLTSESKEGLKSGIAPATRCWPKVRN